MTKLNLTAVLIVTTLATFACSTANAQFTFRSSFNNAILYSPRPSTAIIPSSELIIDESGPIKLYASGKLVIDGSRAHEDCVVELAKDHMTIYVQSNWGPTEWLTVNPDRVNLIEFNGGDGDDTFMIDGLEHMAFGRHQFDCHLNGGNGADYLEGGLGNDILDGGYDRSNDYLVGNEGADIFVRHYWYNSAGFNWEDDVAVDLNIAEGDTREWNNIGD